MPGLSRERPSGHLCWQSSPVADAPLSMFPKTPARVEREPTLRELFMLGLWPLDPTFPLKWLKRRRARG